MPRGHRLPEGYDTLVIVTVACPECEAPRGAACRSLIVTIRNNGTTSRPHFFRRGAFDAWRRENPEKFLKLSSQIVERKDFDPEGMAC